MARPTTLACPGVASADAELTDGHLFYFQGSTPAGGVASADAELTDGHAEAFPQQTAREPSRRPTRN